ncbi:MAG: RNA polymerase sigma factor [Pseudomonadota bacterium]
MSGFAGIQIEPDVIAAAQEHDPAAITVLFRVFATPVYTLACRLLRSRDAADDVTQETFEQLLTNISTFRGDAALATWVRTIAVSRCLMHQRSAWQRKAQALETVPEAAATGSSPEALASTSLDLESALAALPQTARTVVWLHDVEGYTHKEIAQLTGRSASFSKSCLARAHRRLRNAITGQSLRPATRVDTQEPTEPSGTNCLRLETAS